ncbi:MAG TPA: hypothetical protein VGR37_05155 [Longimicrobiaceae bacterium]|nr:hypothetical protein [Longimicrobiaceae bacterium]
MSTGALIFMLLSWTFVLGLVSWSFAKILRGQRHFDPDGIGPASPPVPGAAEDPRR